ncbi:hypothetical protein B296_00041275 [Ensete ventricosum]|uniref:Reticulon domain-containing protein n=1 Tax=Ensete ventricosum TaxID=4639 RepID=A0A426Z4E7_ENSVE|nr:hypothetical protein B296_00041275 [Ensete ventricosum]
MSSYCIRDVQKVILQGRQVVRPALGPSNGGMEQCSFVRSYSELNRQCLRGFLKLRRAIRLTFVVPFTFPGHSSASNARRCGADGVVLAYSLACASGVFAVFLRTAFPVHVVSRDWWAGNGIRHGSRGRSCWPRRPEKKFLSEAATMAEHKEESVGESLLEKITEKFHGGDSSSSDSDGEKSSLVGSSTPPPSAAEVVKAKIYRLFGREKPVHKVLGGGKRTDQVSVPEDLTVNIALSLRYEINWALAALRDIALGRDLKKFLSKYEDKVDAFAEKAQTEFKKHYSVVHAKYLSKIPKGPLKDKKFQ